MKRSIKRTMLMMLAVILLAVLCVTVCAAAEETQTATVSGRLISSTGDPIRLTGTNGKLAFVTTTGGQASFRTQEITVQSDGAFCATVSFDPAASGNPGQYYLYYRTEEDNSLNVLPNRYFYYTADAVSSSKNYGQGTLLDLRSGDISGLELMVDTGWTLTGRVRMHEDAYLTGKSDGDLANLHFGLRGENSTSLNVFSDVIFLQNGVREWTYRAIVPKTPVTCTLVQNGIQLYTSEAIAAETNLYTDKLDIAEVYISGDMQLPDLILAPAKATVIARFTVQDYVQTTIRAYAVTENGTYSSYFMSSNGYYGGTFDETVTIPREDTAETYQLYYEVGYDAGGTLVTSRVYVCADGSLSTDASKAGNFPMQDTVHHIFPLKMPPFAEGRIYIPQYNGVIFYIDVYGRKSGSVYAKTTITVSDAVIKTDEHGRVYVEYSLSDNRFKAGDTYYLQFFVYNEKGDPGRPVWHMGVFYADEDGGLLVGWNDHFNFKVQGDRTNELDVQLRTWSDGEDWVYIQGEHGITVVPSENGGYSASYGGAAELKVTFSDFTDVDLYVNDTLYSASKLAGKTITVSGDTLDIQYADKTYSAACLYGFSVTNIEPVYSDAGSAPNGVIAVYGADGSSREAIFADLAAGDAIRVSLHHDETLPESCTLVAAAFDAAGRMLGVGTAELIHADDLATAVLNIAPCAGAAELRLMLITQNTFAPQMVRWTL